jgi:hypothetical protein
MTGAGSVAAKCSLNKEAKPVGDATGILLVLGPAIVGFLIVTDPFWQTMLMWVVIALGATTLWMAFSKEKQKENPAAARTLQRVLGTIAVAVVLLLALSDCLDPSFRTH